MSRNGKTLAFFIASASASHCDGVRSAPVGLWQHPWRMKMLFGGALETVLSRVVKSTVAVSGS